MLGDLDDLVEPLPRRLELGQLRGDPVALGDEQRERLRRRRPTSTQGSSCTIVRLAQPGGEQLLHELDPLDGASV